MQMTQIQTNDDSRFNEWLSVQGYLDPQGVLTISLREAQAVYCLEDIQRRKENIRQDFIEIAKDLWLVYKHQLWIELGFNNFIEFVYSPSCDMRKSFAYSLKDLGMLLEEGVVTEDDVRGIDPSKMRALLPLLKDSNEDEESRAEWLAKAQTLTTLDLEDELRGHEIVRFSAMGMLADILIDLSSENVFWDNPVVLHIKTC